MWWSMRRGVGRFLDVLVGILRFGMQLLLVGFLDFSFGLVGLKF